MRYGLLADIHEDVKNLAEALRQFRRRDVDKILVLGDIFETGARIEGTTQMLAEAGAEGVWGNHDFGLCKNPSDYVRSRFSTQCLDFMASLRPRLEFDGCLITHVEPWRDAEDILDLWSMGRDESPDRSFADLPHRVMLHGHHHRWKVDTPEGLLPWDCFHPLELGPDRRYVIGVGAVMDGRCGILDTGTWTLTPIDLIDGE